MLLALLLSVGITVLAAPQIYNVRYSMPDSQSISITQNDVTQLEHRDTFTSSNTQQQGLVCYVEGTFTWTSGQEVHCCNAQGGISELPEGWTIVSQDITINSSLFQWKESVTYRCVLKTRSGVTNAYETTVSLTKNGNVLTW